MTEHESPDYEDTRQTNYFRFVGIFYLEPIETDCSGPPERIDCEKVADFWKLGFQTSTYIWMIDSVDRYSWFRDFVCGR